MNLDDYGPLLTAETFLEIDFGERIKAELDRGVISPLVRGPVKRVAVAGNLLTLIGGAIRGTGRRAYGSSLALRTGARSVRFPDVTVYRLDQEPVASFGDRDLMSDPEIVVHVRALDLRTMGHLLGEYEAIPSVQAILLVDHEQEIVTALQRTSPDAWQQQRIAAPRHLTISHLSLTIPHSEIFARD